MCIVCTGVFWFFCTMCITHSGIHHPNASAHRRTVSSDPSSPDISSLRVVSRQHAKLAIAQTVAVLFGLKRLFGKGIDEWSLETVRMLAYFCRGWCIPLAGRGGGVEGCWGIITRSPREICLVELHARRCGVCLGVFLFNRICRKERSRSAERYSLQEGWSLLWGVLCVSNIPP